MRVLFICKYNRFRSRLAEKFFNKYNKNSKNKASSAGIIRGNPVSPISIKVAKKFGINISGTPKGLTSKMLGNNDLYVIVADDVPKDILKDHKKYGKKLEVWKMKDVHTNKVQDHEKIIVRLEKKVKELVGRLK